MPDRCTNCGATIEASDAFCTGCGQAVARAATQPGEGAQTSVPVQSEQLSRREPARSGAKRRGCVRWLCAFAIIAVVGTAAVVALYAFLLRPRLETYLLGQAESVAVTALGPVNEYTGNLGWVSIPESDLRPAVPDTLTGVIKSLRVSLDQDRVTLHFAVLGIPSRISGDASATAGGDLLVRDVRVEGLAWLVFAPSTLEDGLSRFLNQSVVRPRNLHLLAVQITEDQIWTTYKSR